MEDAIDIEMLLDTAESLEEAGEIYLPKHLRRLVARVHELERENAQMKADWRAAAEANQPNLEQLMAQAIRITELEREREGRQRDPLSQKDLPEAPARVLRENMWKLYESCQPCGCDPGASWVCERHREGDEG